MPASPAARPSRRAGLAATLVLAVAVAVLAMSLKPSPSAAAMVDGCTYTSFPFHYVCTQIHGGGLYVDKFVVVRGKGNPADHSVCNFQGKVTVKAPDGRIWRYASSYRPGCQLGRATRTITVNRTYPNGSRACGSFYENAVLQDTACLRIYS
jgi:hypothetical protein